MKELKQDNYVKNIIFLLTIWLLTILISTFIYSLRIVQGNSMKDTFFDGNIVLVRNVNAQKLKHGDIVIVKAPIQSKLENSKKSILIKRIIGLPGDEISITDRKIEVNHKLLKEPYITHQMNNENSKTPYPTIFNSKTNTYYKNVQPFNDIKYKLKKGEFWIMGDNRPVSEDSRFFGAIKNNNLKYKVIKWQPFSREIRISSETFQTIKTIVTFILNGIGIYCLYLLIDITLKFKRKKV